MSGPTAAQIKAVRAVVTDHARVRAMSKDIQQINLLMNLTGPPLPADDARIAVGDGPEWTIPSTGAISPDVLDAVARCRTLAGRLRSVSDALAGLDLPSDDRRALMAIFNEEAATWTARAALWGNPRPPSDPQSEVSAIHAHQTALVAALKQVKEYFT